METKRRGPGSHSSRLTVDYVEKTYAAGKIPGGFFKREGKLRDNEVLTSRLIDRPCRPLFPEGYMAETQVIATVMSADAINPSDVLAMIGASAAIHISPIPWAGPIAGVRVTRVDGEFIANPTYEEIEKGDCELLIAASKDAIVMVEGEAEEMSEGDMVAAIQFGHQAVQGVLELIVKIREAVGKEKWPFEPPARDSKIFPRAASRLHASKGHERDREQPGCEQDEQQCCPRARASRRCRVRREAPDVTLARPLVRQRFGKWAARRRDRRARSGACGRCGTSAPSGRRNANGSPGSRATSTDSAARS